MILSVQFRRGPKKASQGSLFVSHSIKAANGVPNRPGTNEAEQGHNRERQRQVSIGCRSQEPGQKTRPHDRAYDIGNLTAAQGHYFDQETAPIIDSKTEDAKSVGWPYCWGLARHQQITKSWDIIEGRADPSRSYRRWHLR